jgi:predicted nuclease of predicted toxin-antitoxin system
VKFLIDMPLSPALAQSLQARGHDAVPASAIGLGRAPDAEIIRRARDEARTVITADLDYPPLLALTNASGPGLILFRGGDWSDNEITDRLRQVLAAIGENDLEPSILVVDRRRVRRRQLPIR